MLINTYTSQEEVALKNPPTYFHPSYLQTQTYSQFIAYSTNHLFLALDIQQNVAISIPKSPFGSILSKDRSPSENQAFIDAVKQDLRKRNVNQLIIHHPSEIYDDFLSLGEFEKAGGKVMYRDSSQHILLSKNWENKIHEMQLRKLKSLREEGFTFRKMESREFETAYKFLAVCRQTQGLQINISWEHLNQLKQALPDKYESFGVFREGKISALCIAVTVTDEVAYYYLPATSPMFRNQSPMVMLIEGMVNYYYKKGFKFLDLGASSIEGKVQETLKVFKERMDGVTTYKPTLKVPL